MSKKHIGIIIGCVILITVGILMVLWLIGVFDGKSQKSIKVNELYKELNASPEKIEVEMDDEYVGMFTIYSLGKIEQVYSIAMSMNYSYYLVLKRA